MQGPGLFFMGRRGSLVDLSIVLVNYNTKDLLCQCLAQIYEFPPSCSFEVVVVDNASSDGSAGLVKSSYPECRLVENVANLGFAKAANLGIRQSRGRYLLTLTPGTSVSEGLVDALFDFLENNPRAGAVGPAEVGPDGIKAPIYLGLHPVRTPWLWLKIRKLLSPYPGYPGDYIPPNTIAVEVGAISGMCFMARKAAVEKVGLFDEWPFMFGEEIDLSIRLGKGGWKCFVLPGIRAMHHHGSSYRMKAHLRTWVEDCRLASRYYWRWKHYGTMVAATDAFISALNFLARALFLIGKLILPRSETQLWKIREDLRAFRVSVTLILLGKRYADTIMETARAKAQWLSRGMSEASG
jgi:GT2 family glycosyltransferase